MASIFSQSVRDNIYIAFFLVHLAASVVLDTQLLFPNYKEWFPNFATQLSEYYAQSSNDPTIRDGILQPWFRSYVWCELLVQVPVFIVGSLGLWKGKLEPVHEHEINSIYPNTCFRCKRKAYQRKSISC